MSNKFQFFFGLDYYQLDLPLQFFLNSAKKNQLDCYECKVNKEGITFYAPMNQRKRLEKTFTGIKRIKSVGVLGFLFRQLKRPLRVLEVWWVVTLYLAFSNTLFQINYQSTNNKITQQVQDYLAKRGIKTPYLIKERDFTQNLKEELKQEFQSEIAWIEVTQSASCLTIAFNDKRYGQEPMINYEPLIANKSAMVTQFDVRAGEKKVKLNQIVNKGDVLVDNILIDSFGRSHRIAVEGEVWGKTWTTVTTELEVNEILTNLEPFHFLRCLMDCRRQIEKELDEGERILRENILLFTRTSGTITMKVHYTCLENISKNTSGG